MKRALLPVFVVLAMVLTPVLAAVAIWQAYIIKNQAGQITALTHQQQEQKIEQEELTGKNASLQKRNEVLNAESKQLRSKLDAAPAVAEATPSATPKKENPLSAYMKMLKDPKMREMIKAQQRMAMPMLYSDLVKQLNLSPDDAKKLYDLLADQQMARINGDKTNGVDPAADATAALKQFLGDDGYSQYESYQKSISDHMIVNQFSQGLTGQDALTDSQRTGLLQIMSQARSEMPASVLDAGSNASMQDKMAAMSSEDQTNQLIQNQEDMNKKILAQAQGILTPSQLTSLQNQLDQTLKMMQMGIQMSKSMGGGN